MPGTMELIKKTASVKKCEVVYARLFDEIRKGIEDGELAPGTQLPPENLLAQKYRISRSSVRSALNELEERGAIEKRPGLGSFVRDFFPTSETKEIVRTIGINALLPVGNGNENWFGSIIGNTLLSCNLDSNVRISMIRPDNISSETCDGAILLFMSYNQEPFLELEKRGVRTVAFNRIFTHPDLAYVSVNYFRESMLAVRFLLNLGCRRIGIPHAGMTTTTYDSRRLDGAKEALNENPAAGLFFPVESLQDNEYYTEKIKQFVAEQHPDALYLENGSYAVSALNALVDLKLEPGRDIQLLCFDDIAYLYPIFRKEFYCVRMPLENMTRDAADYLLAKIDSPDTPVLKKLYQAEIIRCGKEI